MENEIYVIEVLLAPVSGNLQQTSILQTVTPPKMRKNIWKTV